MKPEIKYYIIKERTKSLEIFRNSILQFTHNDQRNDKYSDKITTTEGTVKASYVSTVVGSRES